jgi:uncharacterized protein YbjT (DUF2867 family)
MILVVGGGGPSGLAVIRALRARGHANIRALVRNQTHAPIASSAGASEVVLADLRDIAAIERSLAGVSAVFHLGPRFLPDEAAIGRAMIEAASAASVERFVYLSVIHPILSSVLHHDAKRLVEEALACSGLDQVVLQPGRFMQNVAFFWPRIVSEGVYAEPFSASSPMSVVDYRDVAEVAARALTDPSLALGTYQLVSGPPMTRHAMAAIIADQLGQTVRAEACSLEEWANALGGLPSPYGRQAMRAMFAHYDRYGLAGGNAVALTSLLGRAPTEYRDFVAHFHAERDPNARVSAVVRE